MYTYEEAIYTWKYRSVNESRFGTAEFTERPRGSAKVGEPRGLSGLVRDNSVRRIAK